MKQYKRGNYWIQKVKRDWNSKAYIDFYEKYGHEWLPKLIDHKRYSEIGEIQMEFHRRRTFEKINISLVKYQGQFHRRQNSILRTFP